jgi:hypothetical protein
MNQPKVGLEDYLFYLLDCMRSQIFAGFALMGQNDQLLNYRATKFRVCYTSVETAFPAF